MARLLMMTHGTTTSKSGACCPVPRRYSLKWEGSTYLCMQHGYWDNIRACSHHRRRRFDRHQTYLEQGERVRRERLKRITRKYWWRVLDDEERERIEPTHTRTTNESTPPFAHPASRRPGPAKGSQFVHVWPLYPECCFSSPFLSRWYVVLPRKHL